jgi:hypothetical protein
MKRTIIIGALVSMLSITGCYFAGPCIQGYGPILTEERDFSDFTGVSNTASFEVRVMQSDTFGVRVEAQENLHQIIETYVSGSTLIAKTRNGTCYQSIAPVIIYVTMPVLEEIRNTGSGQISADRAEADDFECTNTGSGRIRIDSVFAYEVAIKNSGSGKINIDAARAGNVYITQTGSGSIDAGKLSSTDHVDVNHTSSGQVYATIIDGIEVDARLTGSGRIELWGNAETADYSLSASGKIDALELLVADAKASITGSGKIYVYATETLDVTITSSGSLLYRGNPIITTRITGSGSVRPY